MKKLMISAALGAMVLAGGIAVAQTQGDSPRGGFRHAAIGDTNGDGIVTKAELIAALDKRFAAMDTNGDGKVTKEERDAQRQKRGEERFAKLDSDGNGQISKAEFDAAREARGAKRAEAGKPGHDGQHIGRKHHRGGHGHGKMGMMGRGADANKDGVLTKAEFTAGPLAMFDRADANKDGQVTAAERQAAHAAIKAEMKAKWEARKAAAPTAKN